MTNHYLAVDLGAESGRVMLGTLTPECIDLKELHRFANVPLDRNGSLVWDLASLFFEIKTGLIEAARLNLSIDGVSVDSWGVDYVLLNAEDEIMPPSYHYRDARNKPAAEKLLQEIAWEDIYEETGIQFIAFNTLFQLAAETCDRLPYAKRILTMADAFNHWLSGVAAVELSAASTTQLYDPRNRRWSPRLLEVLKLAPSKLPKIVPSGTILGPMLPQISRDTGLTGVNVVAGLSHDTGAAVAAIPVTEEPGDWAFLSSGTWSLIGTELHEPLIDERARACNFTNEIGYDHRVRFLRNVIGLWLIQECRRHWASQGTEYSYAELKIMAAEAEPFAHTIDPDDERFFLPEDMPAEIAGFCLETGQPEPTTHGAMARCILESLALLYRQRINDLSSLTGRNFSRLHVIGGGSRNDLLNQFTADALGIPIIAGPSEATALGNVVAQALAMRKISSLEEARRRIAESSDLRTFQPRNTEKWKGRAKQLKWMQEERA
jgi:rhamnulokinase